NSAVGSNVVGTKSTNTSAEAQILIGSSLSGGLLLNSDQATGSYFEIKAANTEPTPTPSPSPSPSASPVESPSPSPSPAESPSPQPTPSVGASNNAGGRFDERYSGTINPAQSSVDVRFELRRSYLDA